MPHVFERASSGRAKCRGCGQAIAKDTLRFGERMPNPYADGEMTLWFHPACAAHKRPEPFLEGLAGTDEDVEERDRLEKVATEGAAHRRLPRLDGGQRSPSGRARCRSCRETIAKDTWRIPLVYYQDGRFEPAGYIHVGCCADYFETTNVLDRIRHFSPLSDEELAEISQALC